MIHYIHIKQLRREVFADHRSPAWPRRLASASALPPPWWRSMPRTCPRPSRRRRRWHRQKRQELWWRNWKLWPKQSSNSNLWRWEDQNLGKGNHGSWLMSPWATSPNHEWYMVNAMATFLGDVQYSQNGTFTNPWKPQILKHRRRKNLMVDLVEFCCFGCPTFEIWAAMGSDPNLGGFFWCWKTKNPPTIWGWFIAPVYGDFGNCSLLGLPHDLDSSRNSSVESVKHQDNPDLWSTGADVVKLSCSKNMHLDQPEQEIDLEME